MTSCRSPKLLIKPAPSLQPERQHAPDRTEHGGPREGRAERDGRVQIHRASGDARREEVVLDLLVQDDEDQDDQAFGGESMNCTNTGKRAGDVRADDRKELADQTDPQRHGHRRLSTDAWNSTQWKNADSPASSAREYR